MSPTYNINICYYMDSNLEQLFRYGIFPTGISAALLIGLLFTACAPTPDRQDQGVNTATLVWPQPPAPTRIRYVQAFSQAEDLGIKKGFFQRLGEWFTGPSETRLVKPMAVVVTQDETIFVADPGIEGIHRFDVRQGKYNIIYRTDDKPLPSPVALASDKQGNVYLTDSQLAKVYRIAVGSDEARLVQLEKELQQPTGITLDPDTGHLYIVDTARHKILEFNKHGGFESSFGQRGTQQGEFNFPTLIWRDRSGTLYVTDSLNFRIQTFTAKGEFLNQFGQLGDGSGNLSRPKGVATDHSGHIYVMDTLFHSMQVFDQQGRFLLSVGSQGQKPGEFWLPTGIFISENENIYVADAYNRRVQVFRYAGAKP